MEYLFGLGQNTLLGLSTALSPENLLYCVLGVFLGMLLGVLPGIGTLAAMSLLFPITFHLDPTPAIVMLAGVYYGTSYGGSTASILLNLPGTPSSAVTCLDGYPMAQQGRAGVALLMTTLASFAAASFGIVVMMLVSPFAAAVAMQFGSAEYFALMVLGLVIAATTSAEAPLKGFVMILVGIVFGTVGLDLYTGANRFTFGMPELYSGISIVALAMGMFGVSEIISSIRTGAEKNAGIGKISLRSMLPTRSDLKASIMPIVRGSGVGSFFGILPGTGGTIASFVAYAVEKRVSKTPGRFGHGAIEGVVSPEAANNAADQTAFIPTLTLGIPGSASMAMIIGILMIHGLNPGPALLQDAPNLFWGVVMSFWIGNLVLLILNIPLIGLWVNLLRTPYRMLYPSILMFICIGVYSVSGNVSDIYFVIIFGIMGYLFKIFDFPLAPMLLGFVLGPLVEDHFRRAMLYSRGDMMALFQSPISGTLLAIAGFFLVSSFYLGIKGRRKAVTESV